MTTHIVNSHDHTIAAGSFTRKHTVITHLAATFTVEGRGIEHDLHTVTSAGSFGRLPIHD